MKTYIMRFEVYNTGVSMLDEIDKVFLSVKAKTEDEALKKVKKIIKRQQYRLYVVQED